MSVEIQQSVKDGAIDAVFSHLFTRGANWTDYSEQAAALAGEETRLGLIYQDTVASAACFMVARLASMGVVSSRVSAMPVSGERARRVEADMRSKPLATVHTGPSDETRYTHIVKRAVAYLPQRFGVPTFMGDLAFRREPVLSEEGYIQVFESTDRAGEDITQAHTLPAFQGEHFDIGRNEHLIAPLNGARLLLQKTANQHYFDLIAKSENTIGRLIDQADDKF